MSSRSAIAKIKSEIVALQRQDGSYHPQDLVDYAANNRKSELHKTFLWDNAQAGQAYRLWQAREMITRYAVRIEVGNRFETIPVISVPSLRGTEDGSYLGRDAISANEAYRAEVLSEIQAKLRTMRETFAPLLPELKTVWAAITRAC